jgi:glyoxylase I family protein
MLKSLYHVGMVVEDMARSLAFYQEMLGGTVGLDLAMDLPEFGAGVGIPDTKARIVFLQLPGISSQVELIQYLSPIRKHTASNPSSDTPGRAHVAFQVTDIQETYDSFQKKGVKFLSKPSVFPADHPQLGGVAFCYFQDPDGGLLELIEAPE